MHSSHIRSRSPRAAVAALIVGSAAFGGFTAQPAQADSAAVTRNIVLGAAAAVAADIIYNNIHHKQLAHNTTIGQTRDGGTVYADGRVVYPNGDVLYTSNGNGQPCSYQSTYNRCGSNPAVYYPQNYGGQDHGNHYGRNKHQNGDRENRHGNNGEHGHGEHGGHGDHGD